MSADGQQLYQAGLRCDHPECKGSVWRVARSRELALVAVQAAAKDAGWAVCPDRLVGAPDLCPEHAKTLLASAVRTVLEGAPR